MPTPQYHLPARSGERDAPRPGRFADIVQLRYRVLYDTREDRDRQQVASLSSMFSVLALVLASVGIYGVMVLSVAQRIR